MQHLGAQGEGAYRARAEAGDEEEVGEVAGPGCMGRVQHAAHAPQHHVRGPHVVMRWQACLAMAFP